MSSKNYDVIIIGGGPAGLSAGVYSARARLSTLLIEKDIIGGNIVNAELVENYPGFPDGISGFDLTQLMHTQATKFGMETLMDEITGLQVDGKQKTVKTAGGEFTAKAVIIAGGSLRQLLGAPGEKEFTGRGVSYCATCDAAFFTDQPVGDVPSARTSDTARYARFFRSMLRQGVYLAPSQFEAAFLSLAHGEKEIEQTIGAAEEALAGLG